MITGISRDSGVFLNGEALGLRLKPELGSVWNSLGGRVRAM